jgi:hypothetical protein
VCKRNVRLFRHHNYVLAEKCVGGLYGCVRVEACASDRYKCRDSLGLVFFAGGQCHTSLWTWDFWIASCIS